MVRKNIDQPLKIHLNFPGIHNVQNALAAIAVATELNVADNDIVKALKNFTGIERRFQNYGEISTTAGNVILVDDYGHHPTEITATINAIREGWPTRRLVMVFQPHRYTRTRDLLNEFAIALSEVDILILCEVYPASEPPIIGADGNAIRNAITANNTPETRVPFNKAIIPFLAPFTGSIIFPNMPVTPPAIFPRTLDCFLSLSFCFSFISFLAEGLSAPFKRKASIFLSSLAFCLLYFALSSAFRPDASS